MTTRTIWLHPDAPAKPAYGRPCNGCGVCCADRPCPLGMLASRRLDGRCAALRWSEASSRYRCGLLVDPAGARWTARWRAWLVSRWIGAQLGCDSTADTTQARTVVAR